VGFISLISLHYLTNSYLANPSAHYQASNKSIGVKVEFLNFREPKMN
jgi:hypothetical protein